MRQIKENNLSQLWPYKGSNWIYVLPCLLLLALLVNGRLSEGSQQFSELAQAFMHGQTNFLHPIGGLGQDPILFHGKIYWGEGPLPAIILLPFVAFFSIFHIFFYQGYIQWLFILGIIYFVYRLARIIGYTSKDSFTLMLGFILGSVFIGVASVSSSWLFSQVITTFLLFWSLYEFYTRKRWLLIGAICGLILLTRATAAPIIVFFILEMWQEYHKGKLKLADFLYLGTPFYIAIVLVCWYNFIRFHNPFNGGYAYQLLHQDSAESRALGVFSLSHIPANLYSTLLRPPIAVLRSNTTWTLSHPYIQSNPYGMSIFITSPYLLSMFSQKWSRFDRRAKNLMVAIAISLVFVLSFYGIGADQYGVRYSLDYLPAVYLLFMIIYRKGHRTLTRGMTFLLLISGVFNAVLVVSYIK
jgi:hypothetical protein